MLEKKGERRCEDATNTASAKTKSTIVGSHRDTRPKQEKAISKNRKEVGKEMVSQLPTNKMK